MRPNKWFTRIFDVFSKRKETLSKPHHKVPETTRNRVFLWCKDIFSNSRSSSLSPVSYTTEFWNQIHQFLQYRHGRIQLTEKWQPHTHLLEDTVDFLISCSGEEFLDFLEYIFRVDCFFYVRLPEEQVVEELNDLLREDNLPYYLTNFVKENSTETHLGGQKTVIRTIAYPKFIMRESEVLHAHAIEPVLQLLRRPHFKNCNVEFLAALEDYRKGDFADCLTKIGSAFESFLKILCSRKGWGFKDTDTASSLVKTVLSKMTLGEYFTQLFIIVATLRNKLGTAHGAGTRERQVPRHLAQYAINSTASAILLIADEAGES